MPLPLPHFARPAKIPPGYAIMERTLRPGYCYNGGLWCESEKKGLFLYRLCNPVYVIGDVVGKQKGKLVILEDPAREPHLIFIDNQELKKRSHLAMRRLVARLGFNLRPNKFEKDYLSYKIRQEIAFKKFLEFVFSSKPFYEYLYVSPTTFACQSENLK